MVENLLLEIAIFTFIMAAIGLVLSFFEFKKMIKDDKKIKKSKKKDQ